MKSLTTILILLFAISVSTVYSQTVVPAVSKVEMREKEAADIVSNLSKKDYKAVRKDFAKIMLDGLSEEKIKETWESMITKIGEFQKVVSTKQEVKNNYNIIKKRCQFASENATVQVTFNEEDKVVGLYLTL